MSDQRRDIRNLVVVSDLHAGCRLGLAPPDAIQLDDGGTYHASAFQLQMWDLWRDFWDQWVPEVVHGEPFDLCVNGDVIDGTHHNSTTQVSQNIEDQLRIAEHALRPVVERCHGMGGTYFHIRGTQAHVGQSAVWEEQLAARLGAKPNAQGQFARYDLWKHVGDALCHVMHHVGTTSSAAHEASAVNAELTAEYVEAARWGRRPPDFVVRSHRHRCIAVDLDSARGQAAAIVTPGWQGKTPFAWKVAGARIAEPQFGGICIRQNDRRFYYERRVWSLERSAAE